MRAITRILGASFGIMGLLPVAAAQTTQLASQSSAGVHGDGDCLSCSMSADGRFIAFESRATNLVGVTDTNAAYDIFVRDRWSGTTELVSQSSTGVQANSDSYAPKISGDGRYVVFSSRATNLAGPIDVNGTDLDVFLRDRANGTTELVSVSSTGDQGNGESKYASISADGRFVCFSSRATNLVPHDTNFFLYDLFLRDRANGTTEIVSRTPSGAQGNGNSFLSAVTPDGRFVVFQSGATNLTADADTNGDQYDIFVRDRSSATTELVSQSTAGVHGNAYCYNTPAITSDGRFVAFSSRSTNLLAVADANGFGDDIFLRDRWSATTELVSLSTSGAQGNAACLYGPTLSSDGRYVAFSSTATNLLDGSDANGSLSDIVLRDRLLGTTELVSLSSVGAQSDANSYEPSISADGRFLAYWSFADNLVPLDDNGKWDVFVRDRSATGFTIGCEPSLAAVIGCPCSNPPAGPGRGCDNSAATGGASMTASGVAHLSMDSLVFTTSSEKPGVMSILLQGNGTFLHGIVFGQGVSCVGGTIVRRLYSKIAFGGSITVPDFSAGDPPVSAQSASMGDVIQPGMIRYYLVYYRDAIVLGGCPATSMFNASHSGQVVWSF